MSTRTLCRAVPLALLCATPAGGLAQSAAVEFTPRAGYETYRFDDAASAGIRTLSLFTVELAALAGIGRATLDVTGAFAEGRLERQDGSEASVSGLTDTRVQLTLPVVQGHWNLVAIGVLPTGDSDLTESDAEVAGAVAADLLPFRISNWGAGGGFGVGSNLAGTVGAFGVGIGATYLVGREFDLGGPSAFAYRPGNLLALRAVVDRNVGAAGKLSLQLTMTQSEDDRGDGANFYRAGDRYQAVGSYAFASGSRASGLLYAGWLHRTTGVFLLQESARAPAQDLALAGGAVRVRAGRTLLQPLAELRLLRRSDGTGQGWLVGVGGSVEWPAAAAVAIAPTVRARFGSVLVREGQESGFTGVDAGVTLRFGSVPR